MEQTLRSGKRVNPEPSEGPSLLRIGTKETGEGDSGDRSEISFSGKGLGRHPQQPVPPLPPAVARRQPSLGYHVRQADPGDCRDRAEIMRLWLDNLPHITPAICTERFEWLYQCNPAGPLHTWLVTDGRKGSVIGCASVMPRQFVIGGGNHRGGLAVDFTIDKRHRSYGVALRLQRTISEQIWDYGMELLFTYPNPASRGVFKRIGYREVGRSWCGARLIRSFGKLRRHLRPIPLAATVGAGVDLVLLMQNRISLRCAKEAFQVSILDEPDARWQRFWERRCGSIRFGVSHDMDYLRWRHCQPGVSQHLFSLFDATGELLGYLSFTRHGDVLTIKDIQLLSDRWLRLLLDRFWQEMHRTGALVIDLGLVGTDSVIKRFHQAGFIARPGDGWAGVLPGPKLGPDLLELLQTEGDGWYLADADLDL